MAQDVQITPTAGMPPVATTTEGTTVSNEQSGIQRDQAAVDAANAEVAAAQAVAQKQQEVANSIAAQVGAQAAAKEAVGTNLENQAAEQQKLIAAKQPIIDEAKRLQAVAEKRYENHQFYDYWSKRSTGDYIVSRIAMGLNAFANGGLGIPGNEVADKIRHDIEMDFNKQKLALHSKQQIAEWRRQGVKDLYEELQREMSALTLKQAKANEAVGAKAEAMALRAGIPEAEAKQNVITAQSQQEAARLKKEAEQRYEQHGAKSKAKTSSEQITTAKGAAGGGVEADKNAGQAEVIKEHGQWMASELPKLTPDEVKTINRVIGSEQWKKNWPGASAAIGTIFGVDPETGASPRVKEYVDRLHRYEEAFGRLESGGAIGKEESASFQDSARPRLSDTPKDRQMRARNLSKDITLRGQFLERAPKNAVSSTPQQLSARERAGIATALARYKKNPNDAKAKQVLELYRIPLPESKAKKKDKTEVNTNVAPTQPPPFVPQ